MRRRESKGGAPPTDLLVCFPSRTHLALMPKPVSSPVRPMEPNKRRNHPPHQHHLNNQQIVRSSNRGGQASPVLWAKNKAMESETDEPTSPKVTCAGQIKVKSKRNSNWQSVMEEIERIHHSSSSKLKKKKPTWVEALGLKKDVMTFLSCLRGMRIDLRCFGSFHHQTVLSSSDDEDDEDDSDQNHEPEKIQKGGGDEEDGSGSSENVFSKWFMVLEENQNRSYNEDTADKDDEEALPCAPPPNALLLMRCRSAPAKSWLEEKLLQEQDDEDDGEALKAKLDLEEKKNKESLVFKYYAPDFFKVSSDIAKETWVVGGTKDPLSRSRSWKR
ncbi:hypothetical protein ACHQM5_016662 [Ranunculus cassubicifolius]